MAAARLHETPTAVHAVPAAAGPSGFRLLVMREFRAPDGPPGFALMEQYLLRAPHRLNRHGIAFALTFRPEVMAGLSEAIGRSAVRDEAGRAGRNPRWPHLRWHAEPRRWADGTDTVEWWAQVDFPDAAAWAAFRARFAGRLDGAAPAAPAPEGELPCAP
ncbi:hypothetical protein V5F38_18710 [Xanthobacter sp. V0B-10]|uniref:hypothetical protein n=1 Tax=Xanthobacter albus TaxID=3119929 RepID=UPI00372AB952